jgi:hypothetical protein
MQEWGGKGKIREHRRRPKDHSTHHIPGRNSFSTVEGGTHMAYGMATTLRWYGECRTLHGRGRRLHAPLDLRHGPVVLHMHQA